MIRFGLAESDAGIQSLLDVTQNALNCVPLRLAIVLYELSENIDDLSHVGARVDDVVE